MEETISTAIVSRPRYRTTTDVSMDFHGLFSAEDLSTAFHGMIISRRFVRSVATDDLDMFFCEIATELTPYFAITLREFHTLRVSAALHPLYGKPAPEVSEQGEPPPEPTTSVLRTAFVTIATAQVTPSVVYQILDTITPRHADLLRGSPGLRLLGIRMADVYVAAVGQITHDRPTCS